MKTTADISKNYQAALTAVQAAEAKNLSMKTMQKYYKALFAAEDALKASGVWL